MIVRRAGLYDMAALAGLYRATRATSLPFLPDLHTADEDRRYFESTLFADFDVWAAEEAGALIGYIAFRGGFVQHLFVDPSHHGRGVGGQLLDLAKAAYAELGLWTFQQNARARAFYEAKGFTAQTLTDGQDNEERLPDVFYVWKRNRTAGRDE